MSRTPPPCNPSFIVESTTRPASPLAARCKDYTKLCSVSDSQGTESTPTPESPSSRIHVTPLFSPTAAPVVNLLPRSPSPRSTSSGVHVTPLFSATTAPVTAARHRSPSREDSVTAGGGEPPKKRRRLDNGQLSRVARGFLDLEAEDADEPDDDEGSDAEMNDFLDDTALAVPSGSPSHPRRSRSPEDHGSQVLWQIAEGIRERARQRIHDAAPPSVVEHLPLDMDPGKDATPIPYLVSMPANARLEQKLIRWLQGSVPGVVSAVSHDLGSGHIYVTALHYAYLQLGLEEWPLAWNLSEDHRKPQQLSPFEYQRAMDHQTTRQARIESPPDPGTWARFAADWVTDTGFITLAGDILVLLGQGLALSVPRIPEGPVVERARDVPQRLCFPASLTQAHPHTKEQIFTEPSRQCWCWGSRRFRDSGLELFAVDDAEVTVDGVEPTDDERELFASSGDGLLCRPSLALPAAALHPGDRVVYRVPGSNVKGGHIQCISQDDDRVAVATVLPDGEPLQCVRVPVSQLRLHLLAMPRTLSCGDRVVVVGGPHIGTNGHIHEMLGQRMLSIEPSVDGLAGLVTVEEQQVQVCFRLGDVVEVTRGTDKGVTGFIVATFHGGYVEVYPLSAREVNPVVNALCKVRTLDIRLVLTETAASGTASSVVRPGEEAQLQRERDRQREAWEDDMRCMGRLLRGLEVRIVRKHQEKAMYGTIVDYRHLKSQPAVDTVPREDMGNSIDSILADVQLQIRLENEGRQVTVTSAKVVERSTGLSVEAAALLKAQKLLHLFASVEDTTEPPLQADCETDVAWGVAPASQLPLVPVLTVPDIGEETGLWLAHYQLINKRVDVFPVTPQQLEEINRRTPQLRRDRKINGKTAVMSRLDRTRAGYLVPLTEGVPPSKVPGWSVWCKFPPSYNAKMCVVTLRPCRQTDVDRQNPVAKCISAVRGRVIIIGPDVDGSHAQIGQYAETIPQEDGEPTTIVKVRFPKTRDFSGIVIQPIGRYHLVCLCRALNSVIPGADDRCYVTDFDANPP